jgi:hypothetical protein
MMADTHAKVGPGTHFGTDRHIRSEADCTRSEADCDTRSEADCDTRSEADSDTRLGADCDTRSEADTAEMRTSLLVSYYCMKY